MNIEDKKIQFFKNRILNRLEELHPYMSNVKYKLYVSMVNECNSINEIRGMAELDMQFEMIKYVKDLCDKLETSDTSIEELEAVTNANYKAAKLVVIEPKKKVKKNKDIENEVEATEIINNIDDQDILDSAARLISMRINSMPIEEKYRDEILENEDNELTEDSVDDIEVDDDFYVDIDEDDEDDEDGIDIDIDEDELFGSGEDSDEENEDDTEEEVDAEEIIDFGLSEEQSNLLLEENEHDSFTLEQLDSMDDSLFIDDIYEDEESDEDEEDNIDSIGDDLFDDSLDSDEEEEEEEDDTEFDVDNIEIDEDDIFIDDENIEDEEDIDSAIDNIEIDEDDIFIEEDDDNAEDEETDIDSLGDDLFDDETPEEEYDDDSDEEDNIDSLGDDLFGDDDYIEDEDASDNIDSIDVDDLFSDIDEDEVDDDSDIDDDEFDIDESELSFDAIEDDDNEFDKLFEIQDAKVTTQLKRETAPDRIFINGTEKGNQTQQMFNMLTKFINKGESVVTKTSSNAKVKLSNGIKKISNSDMFKL